MLLLAGWHFWAIASAVFAGFFSFVIKIAAERTHGSIVFNALVSTVSFVLALIGFWWTGDSFSMYGVMLGAANGALFVFGTLARSDSLAYIHATLFFPIYKIIGPVLVLMAGMLLFGEHLSFMQSVGFCLALGTSLLLIDRTEQNRQKNLAKGVVLAVISAILMSAAQVFSKAAMAAGVGVFAFAMIPYAMTVLNGAVPLVYRHRFGALRESGAAEMAALCVLAGVLQIMGFLTLLLAFQSGPAGAVYAINSIYIVIPIVLSIWYYGEHWNARKVLAIVLSIGAVVLLR